MDSQAPERKNIQLSSYQVKRGFGLYKYCLMEILSDVVAGAPSSIETMPPQIWRVLSSWFLEYEHNNLYQCLFFKIVELVIKNDDYLEAQKTLFSKYKFLTKIIQHFNEFPKTGCKGFIVMLCNIVRLAAALQPSTGYLRHLINSSILYKSFIPKLKEATEIQLKRYSDMEALESDEEEVVEDMGVDLGSHYARSLGFEQEPSEDQLTDKQKKYLRKRENKRKKKEEEKKKIQEENKKNGKEEEVDEKPKPKPEPKKPVQTPPIAKSSPKPKAEAKSSPKSSPKPKAEAKSSPKSSPKPKAEAKSSPKSSPKPSKKNRSKIISKTI